MAAAIKGALGLEVQLVVGEGGIFEVLLDDTLVYSNAGQCGCLPTFEDILNKLEASLGAASEAGRPAKVAPSPSAGKFAASCGCQEVPRASLAGACCSPATGRAALPRQLLVEFLYLDLEKCSRCRETEQVLDEAVAEVRPVLRTTGIELELRKIHVQSEEQARDLGFISSPTIRVNGRDLQEELRENLCESCSDLCGDEVNCRVWVYNGEEYVVPPKALLVEALLRAAYGNWQSAAAPPGEPEVPENLRRFFRLRGGGPAPGGGRCCG